MEGQGLSQDQQQKLQFLHLDTEPNTEHLAIEDNWKEIIMEGFRGTEDMGYSPKIANRQVRIISL